MPREVKTVFNKGPTLFKFDDRESGKNILNIISQNIDKISQENQSIIKNILGINNDFEISCIENNSGFLTLENNDKKYIISVLNNTFMIV